MPMPLMAIAPHVGRNNVVRRSNSLPGNIQNNEEGYTRSVDPNELVSTHVQNLGASDNRGLRQSRMRGMQAGASRGGINSNLAAATGENAWLDAATDMGMQQAGAYQSAASENLDSLGRQRISQEGNSTQIATTQLNNNTAYGIARDRNDFERETDLRRRDWDVTDDERDYGRRTTERQQDRDWNVDDRDFDERQSRRRNREGLAATTIQTILQNPEYMRDPAGAAGLIQFFQDMWNDQFGEGP